MKRKILFLSVVAILAMMMTTTAFAQTGKGNPSGEVTGIDPGAGTLTMLTADGVELTVSLPSDFDYSTVEVGMVVTAKGDWTEAGFDADWVKPSDGEDEDSEADTGDEGEGETGEGDPQGNAYGEGGIFCAGGKDKPHPMAEKIAEDYGVSVEWVMDQACEGHGFGGVLVALQTQDVTGEGADGLLEKRNNGQGWGQIWKDAGIVGNPHADNPPPGQLKKPDKETGRPEDKGEPGPPEGKGPPDDKGPANKDKDSNNAVDNDDEAY